jgi:hypothetical protein
MDLLSEVLRQVDLQLNLKVVTHLQVHLAASRLDLLVIDLKQVIHPLDLLLDLKEVSLLVVLLPDVLEAFLLVNLLLDLKQMSHLVHRLQASHLEYLADCLLDHRAVGHRLEVLPVDSPLGHWVEHLQVDFLVVGHKDQDLPRVDLEGARVVFQAERVVSLVIIVARAKRRMTKATTLLFLVSLVLIIQSFLRYHKHLSSANSNNSLGIMPMWRHGAKLSIFVPITRLMISCVLMALSSISNISSVCGGINLTATVPLVYTG